LGQSAAQAAAPQGVQDYCIRQKDRE